MATEKYSTTEKCFLEVMEKGKREIKKFLDELTKEKEEESYKESRNEKLEKLKVDDLRVGEKLLKNFVNGNKGDVRNFLKIKKYDKRPMHMMDPILDDAIYRLLSKYDLDISRVPKASLMGLFKISVKIKISVLN